MRSSPHLVDGLSLDLAEFDLEQPAFIAPIAVSPAITRVALTGSTTAGTSTALVALGTPSLATNTTVAAIAPASPDVLAGKGQSVSIGSMFNVSASSADPAYLIVSGLDRDEYTVGYKTSAMGHLAIGTATQNFADASGDAWSVSVVFTYNASTGQYVNATYGKLSQLSFDTGSNLSDTTTFTLFGTSSASMAATYAANPLIMSSNPSYFTDYGSVAVITGASAATAPTSATPDSIVSAALSFVGDAWNQEGCWVLASDISAKAGATLPLTSAMGGVAGIGNGEWFVAYNGPVSANANWVNNLVVGEMVSFITTSGGGHITTVVSGQGSSADLVDNITYIGANGSITDAANDGSSSDVIIQAPHAASQEFTGVNAADVVVYELDCPVVTATLASVSVLEAANVSLATDFSASNPKSGQSVTEYQVYQTNAADSLMVSGTANKTALSAATACTLTSLSGLSLTGANSTNSDMIEVRAYNGSYWGDWTSITVNVAAPAILTASAAVLMTGTSTFKVSDTAANISAEANALQALAAAGRLTATSVTGGGLVTLTVAQITSDHNLLALLPASGALSIAGATAAQAAALQSNAQVASFTITDTAADVSAKTALGADTKLSAITITGTTGADTLNLTGIAAAVTINLGGNAATAIGGLSASIMTFITPPDIITLGAGAATIVAGLTGTSGIEVISNFKLGLDQLQLNLGNLTTLTAFNTTYGGAHAVDLTGGGLSEGVVLINQPSTVTASSILASHVHITSGVATIT